MAFVHLHVHTQYSVLDGQSSPANLFKRAKELNMPALALTDHGNMYGVKDFLKVAKKYPEIKPIIGCEVYVSKYDHKLKDREHRAYYHLILLAKNYDGYKNLMKIVSLGHIEGMYYKPRVSHEIIEKYHGNLICCSACIAGEVPRLILEKQFEAAEEAVLWHKSVFGDDYYLEVQNHRTDVPGLSQEVYEKQMEANKVIFELAEKHKVKVVATNDVHFVRKEDGPTHDRFICLMTKTTLDDEERLRYTQQEYLKSEEEMRALFPDHPEVIDHTAEIADKIEAYKIDRDHVLPKFELPEDFLRNIDSHRSKYQEIIDAGKNDEKGNDRGEEFKNSVAYLCHLCYRGAEKKYREITAEVKERIDFELQTISRMGFPDYFLIVQDFISYARSVGISVGPGRGSAAGSVVSYCLGITNLDPIKYDLLFERFLNPERISMPDIDVDFDDEGRYKVIQYVQDKYGLDHISHVITFGTMAAKSAIKDVGRISGMPPAETARLAKMVPDKKFSIMETKEAELKDGELPEDGDKIIEKDGRRFRQYKEEVSYDNTLENCLKFVPEFKNEYENGNSLVREVLKYAIALEGSIRQTGIHACAMIIGRGNLTDYIPITLGTDKATGQEVWVSQYEGTFIEDVGMLKMDFLGLRTLSIIKECVANIKAAHGIDIDIDNIDINDPLTYELYSRGDTQSVFQFESPGMKEWLKRLHPTRFEDLIAMNALYRPGPMEYIPQFVARKQGEEPISYDLPELEDILKDTYGVTVYQEQVMLISQKIAGFSKGKADKLRKAMGKKQIDVLESLHSDFIEGATKNGHPKDVLEKIWKDWREFAKYAFNKSHATCYAWVSFQTGWLKAHYPAEFQAANLSQNLNNMEEIKVIMSDCKKNNIKVLIPDINESSSNFVVNKDGNIRFGLGGIKGFGGNVVDAILKEREAHGFFADIYDFAERMAGVVNRKSFESLIAAGAFDSFGIARTQFSLPGPKGEIFLDELLNYADLSKRNNEDNGVSLFGEIEELKPMKPEIPELKAEEDRIALIHEEKELVGMYLSYNPLEQYFFEMEHFTNCKLVDLPGLVEECEKEKKRVKVTVAGLISSTSTNTTNSGRPWSKTIIEDFSGQYELSLFGKDYETFMSYLTPLNSLLVEGEICERFFSRKDEQNRDASVPYAFKVRKIRLLGNVAEEYIKGLTINVTTPMLNETFRKDLVGLLKNNPGKIPLSMFLYDPLTKYKIEFLSKKFSVNVSNELIHALDDLGLKYKVISSNMS